MRPSGRGDPIPGVLDAAPAGPANGLPHPVAESTRPRVLVMEQRDESLGCRQQLAIRQRRACIR
jgi:hypothetical protein